MFSDGNAVDPAAIQAGPYGMLPPGRGSQPWGGPPGFNTRPLTESETIKDRDYGMDEESLHVRSYVVLDLESW